MKLGAGELDSRVAVLARTVTEDDYGGEVETWAESGLLSAKVNYGTGREQREAAQEVASLPATVLLRWSSYTSALGTADNRLRFDGGDWDIESVAPLGRGVAVSVTVRRRLT
jgi:head-tail adaptor